MGGGTVVVVVLVIAAAIAVPLVRRRQHVRAEHPDIGLPGLGELEADAEVQPKSQTRAEEDRPPAGR